MLIKMTVRLPIDPKNFIKWTKLPNIHLGKLATPTDIISFDRAHSIIIAETISHPGYLGYKLIDTAQAVYSCVAWKDADSMANFIKENDEKILSMMKARVEFLKACNLYTVDSIVFEVDHLDEITLELVETKYYDSMLAEQTL